MAADEQVDPARARATRLGKRIVIGAYGGFAAAFVLYAAVQITIECFGLGGEASQKAAPLATDCAAGIASLSAAVQRAAERGRRESDAARSEDAFAAALAPEWHAEQDVRRTCERSPRGTDAFAALLRLRVAEQARASVDAAKLSALRRELGAYLK